MEERGWEQYTVTSGAADDVAVGLLGEGRAVVDCG
jgi:hypothetical protein